MTERSQKTEVRVKNAEFAGLLTSGFCNLNSEFVLRGSAHGLRQLLPVRGGIAEQVHYLATELRKREP
jgi:hypothetical protein